MKTSKLNTLESLLSKGVCIENEGKEEFIPISMVFIPKIQRAYAQGRLSENEVRSEFLDDIFATLTDKDAAPMELSFLFGSKQSTADIHDGFELLDGQQRATTLFLLYWYMSTRENKSLPDFLHKFTYETRDTSRAFLDHITTSLIDIDSETPSRIIKGLKWFTDDYNCDPTIVAMLNMIDAIHLKYNALHCTNLSPQLNKLCFYVLMLEQFDMNDELYIKMNSRGLSLTAFENFKASIVKYMKEEKHDSKYTTNYGQTNQPFWLYFTTMIDASWVDMLWRKEMDDTGLIKTDDKAIGYRYFRFFNRYFFSKAAEHFAYSSNNRDSIIDFFYAITPQKDNGQTKLLCWKSCYIQLFDSYQDEISDCFIEITRIFEILHINQNLIEDAVKQDPYGNLKDFCIDTDNYTLHKRVAFSAVMMFLAALPDRCSFTDANVQTCFKQMLRVLFNVIENTQIEDILPAIGVIKNMSKLISSEGAVTENFYKPMTTFDFKTGQLAEEVLKAKEMFTSGKFDESWEKVFITAEQHSFFKGSIRFFFTPGIGSSSDFENRFNVIKTLFDGQGISSEYRKEHILIRAILAQINDWNGLSDMYITENAEKNKFLKNTIRRYERLRTMFCNYFDQSKDMKSYLQELIDCAQPEQGQDERFGMMFHRLVNDSRSVALFDWIAEREAAKDVFRISARYQFGICIPYKRWDKMLLDTERNVIIKKLYDQNGMLFEDENEHKLLESPVFDVWNWEIPMSKELVDKHGSPYKLRVVFRLWEYEFPTRCVEIQVFGLNTDYIIQSLQLQEGNYTIIDGGVRVVVLPYYKADSYQGIADKLDDIKHKL